MTGTASQPLNKCSPPSLLDTWIAEKTGLMGDLSPASLREWQFARLRETLAYARERSRFYNRTLAGRDLDAIRGPADLAELPFTTAVDLREDSLRFVCVSQSEVARIMTLQTSGTSGKPKRIFFTAEDQELCLDFFARGMRTMIEPGETARVWLGSATPGNTVDLLCRGLERFGARSLACSFAGAAYRTLTVEERQACHCLVGIPVWMLQLARANPELSPRSVLLCWDYVPGAIVKTIKSLWGCRIFTHYGSTESGLGGAVSCADNENMHPRAADLLYEIIDPASGLPVPEGTCGEVVFTTLTRRAMPLIRYRTGDRARLVGEPCSCGSRLPRLSAIQGRCDNRVALPGKGELSIHHIDEQVFSLPDALDFTAELRGDATLRLTVWLRPDNRALGAEQMLTRLRDAFAPLGLIVEADFIRDIPPPFLPVKRGLRVLR